MTVGLVLLGAGYATLALVVLALLYALGERES